MNPLLGAVRIECLKARRSRMPLATTLVCSLMPLAGGFVMVVLKDPELARQMGLIGAKAQIAAGTADWPAYLGFLAQATAMGGLILFSFIASWVFGREYAGRTIHDLLALPTARRVVVLAKFVIVTLWCGALTACILGLAVVLGWAIDLPPVPWRVLWQGAWSVAVTACLTVALVTPVAFVASAGRGYLPAMGLAILAMVLAQLVTAAGWGDYFPWAVPALHAGTAGPPYAGPGVAGYAIWALTSLAGLLATLVWWELADHGQ